MDRTKPFPISKRQVWEAWKKVKANQGGAGIDGQTIEAFEAKVGDNLYKLWNRHGVWQLSPASGSTWSRFPSGTAAFVRWVSPTVEDRVAQTVVKEVLEPELEKHFHPDSYGYRPGKSAHQALGQARERCWRSDWVLDLDIRSFFDTLDHDLLLRAVRRHTEEKWVVLYIERWLKAPVVLPNGEVKERDRRHASRGCRKSACLPIFSCTMCSIRGWNDTTRQSASSAMPMISSAIVAASGRHTTSRAP